MKKKPHKVHQKSAVESEISTAPAVCLNCKIELLGEFCYKCGQQANVKRFDFKVLLTQLYTALRKFDTEIRNTFFALLIRPGRFCRNYLAGKRKSFTDPFRYFFFTFVLQVTIFGLVRYISKDPEVDDAAKVGAFTQIIILSSVIFWAIAFKLVFRRAAYNLAENVVCMLYVTSQLRLFSIVLQLLFLPLAPFVESESTIRNVFELMICASYLIFFSRRFFNEPFINIVLKNLLILIIFIALFVPVFFIELLASVLIKSYSN